MKILQICIPTGILLTIVLLLLAINTKPPIEYRYDRCLQNLMENYEIASEELALARFKDLSTAKAKILEADQMLNQINRMGEGPVNPAAGRFSNNQRAYVKQLQAEARQLLTQLEDLGLVSN
ncbi:MAG: hypothetical protein HRU41_03255 [Saprospiraceae bacterium]|nr:hypothetical protein [Saprospiraceae bacterium]